MYTNVQLHFIVQLISVFLFNCWNVEGKISIEDTAGSDINTEASGENIGATITQVTHHPFSASIQNNGTYICSAVVLNPYWLLTVSKCFDPSLILSYATYYHLKNFTIRVGSSYNNKGGSEYKMRMMMHNFDMRVSAIKVQGPMVFSSQVQAVQLPNYDTSITLGYLVSIVAWTPTGHLRLVNAPAIETSICDSYTKLKPGQYICIGGVQDPERHFCRKDNGGAVIQNNTLIALTSFILDCAHYGKAHAFPKITPLLHWLDSTIWDEDNRPSTQTTTVITQNTTPKIETNKNNNLIKDYDETNINYEDGRNYNNILNLPFNPINLPLQPSEDNAVMPKMSLYESYLKSLEKTKITTVKPKSVAKKEAPKKWNKAMMMQNYPQKYDQFQMQ